MKTEKQKKKLREYYKNNKDKWQRPETKLKNAEYRKNHRKERLEAGRKRRITARNLIYKIKSVPCADCGKFYPPYVMDLDHIGKDKIMDVSSMVDNGRSITTILLEVEKCEVVCSNCHRIRTYNRKNNEKK